MVDVTIVTQRTDVQVSETVVEVSIVPVYLLVELGNAGIPGQDGQDGTGGGGSGESYAKLSTSTSLTAADTHKVFTNEGATGLVIVDIPASAQGLKFTFLVTDNTGGFKLDFAGSNTGRLGSAITSAGGTLTGAKPGCAITIRGTDTGGYITESAVGVWKEA